MCKQSLWSGPQSNKRYEEALHSGRKEVSGWDGKKSSNNSCFSAFSAACQVIMSIKGSQRGEEDAFFEGYEAVSARSHWPHVAI